jgi:hypothetical protein
MCKIIPNITNHIAATTKKGIEVETTDCTKTIAI